ncbi:type II secretion system protein [Candidatus Nomurabacteria bacterium]|nr:type II secretion system protein [Candidatus Kaiserbacteria bacterium]MCB9814900.1 type II secretion system protein [Candidatus Nomurabacteria bacterium]
MKKLNLKNSGFSLVETLVAVSILLIVIVSPMSISSKAANSTSFSSEQVAAFFLAQEGVEIAQKARDDLLLKNFTPPLLPQTAWNNFTNTSGTFSPCYNSNGCGLELYTNNVGGVKAPVSCGSTGAACNLYYNDSNGRSRYTYTTANATKTIYTRVITFQKIGTGSVLVKSRVYWRAGSRRDVQEAVVETYLFNIFGS